jgi:hypothetical protein
METKKQTAVELLIDQLKTNYGFKTYLYDEFKQALAMEKQQIVDAYLDGCEKGFNKFGENAEQYYNETYGN